jgi:NADPH:quinone reductase-like Zn-dependent oxidoreductase
LFDSFPRSVRALKRGGRARFVTGAADPKQADLVFLQDLIDAGRLRTVIGRRYTLDDIAEAHRYADAGTAFFCPLTSRASRSTVNDRATSKFVA